MCPHGLSIIKRSGLINNKPHYRFQLKNLTRSGQQPNTLTHSAGLAQVEKKNKIPSYQLTPIYPRRTHLIIGMALPRQKKKSKLLADTNLF
jgi:hypothetical protein